MLRKRTVFLRLKRMSRADELHFTHYQKEFFTKALLTLIG